MKLENGVYSALENNPQLACFLSHPDVMEYLQELSALGKEGVQKLLQNRWYNVETDVEVANNIMSIPPILCEKDILDILARNASKLCGAVSATCRILNEEKQTLVATGSYHFDMKRLPEIPMEGSVAGLSVKNNRPFFIPEITKEDLYKEKEIALNHGLNSLLALPIRTIDYEGSQKKERVIGCLQLYFENPNPRIYEMQIRYLLAIISRVSFTLTQKRKADLQVKTAILQEGRKAILDILKKTKTLDQVLNFLAAKMAQIMGVTRCSLFSIKEDPQTRKFAVLIAGYPLDPQAHTFGIQLSFDQHPAFQEVFQTRESLLISDIRKDPRVRANIPFYREKGIDSVFFLPIKNEKNEVIYVLVLDGLESRALTKEDALFCETLMRDAEFAIMVSLQAKQRHDYLNQLISLAFAARRYSRKINDPAATEEEKREIFDLLIRNILNIEDTVTDNLPYAQLEQTDLNQVIRERLLVTLIPPYVVLEKVNLDGKLIIQADSKKIGRIVGNLISNALQAIEELEFGTLKIATYTRERYAVIEIGNTGYIPPQLREQILKEYETCRQEKGGTGQGLSIVRTFTVMHNGHMEVESQSTPPWTVFRIVLPMERLH